MTRDVAQHLVLAMTLGGYLGGVLALVGYGLVSSGRLSPTSAPAVAVSSVGAALMVASGVLVQAWPSVAVNTVWIGLGVAGLLRARAAAAQLGVPTTEAATGRPTGPRWADDWDTAAEQLATGSLDVVPAPRGRSTAGPACPATAPLPVVAGTGRPA